MIRMLIKKEIIDGELVLRMILFPVTYCLVNNTYSDNFRIRETANENIKGLIFIWVKIYVKC